MSMTAEDLTPADVTEVMSLVVGFHRTFEDREVAKACTVLVLMDRHGWTETHTAERVTLAVAFFDRARERTAV